MPVKPSSLSVRDYISTSHTNPKTPKRFITQRLHAHICYIPLIIQIWYLALFFHGEYGSVKETLMVYVWSFLSNSTFFPTCYRTLSQWVSFMIPISFTTLPIESPSPALDLIRNTCTNPTLSAYIWAHLLPRIEVSSVRRASVYNLTLNLLSFWDNRSVRYLLISGNLVGLTFIYVVTFKVALDFSRPIPIYGTAPWRWLYYGVYLNNRPLHSLYEKKPWYLPA